MAKFPTEFQIKDHQIEIGEEEPSKPAPKDAKKGSVALQEGRTPARPADSTPEAEPTLPDDIEVRNVSAGEIANATNSADNVTIFINDSVKKLKDAGYGDADIDSFMIRNNFGLKEAGFTDEQINQYSTLKNLGYPYAWRNTVKDPSEPPTLTKQVGVRAYSPADFWDLTYQEREKIREQGLLGLYFEPEQMNLSTEQGIITATTSPGTVSKIIRDAKTAFDPTLYHLETPEERIVRFLHAFDPVLNPVGYLMYKALNGRLLNAPDILFAIGKRAGIEAPEEGKPIAGMEEEFLRALDYDPSGLMKTVGDTVELIGASLTGGRALGISMKFPKSATIIGKAATIGGTVMPMGATEAIEKDILEKVDLRTMPVDVMGEAAKYFAYVAGTSAIFMGAFKGGKVIAESRAGRFIEDRYKDLWDITLGKLANKVKAMPEESLIGRFRDTIGEKLIPLYKTPVGYPEAKIIMETEKRLAAYEADQLITKFNGITKTLDNWSVSLNSMDDLSTVLEGKAKIETIPKELHGWVQEARETMKKYSLMLADYWDAHGKPKLAAGIRKNADTYLPRKFREYESKGILTQLIRPRYIGGEFKMRRDKWIVYVDDVVTGKHETLESANASIKARATAAIDKKLSSLTPQIDALRESIKAEPSAEKSSQLQTLIDKNIKLQDSRKELLGKLDTKLSEIREQFGATATANVDKKIAAVQLQIESAPDPSKVTTLNARLAKLQTQKEKLITEMGIPETLPPEQEYTFTLAGQKITIKPPLSQEELEVLGVIRDPRYLMARAIIDGKSDIENLKFLSYVDDQWGHAAPTTFEGERFRVGDLKEWADTMDFIHIPNTEQYGPLADKYVPRRIGKDIIGTFGEKPSLPQQIWDTYLNYWKVGHIVFNPATHTRNLVGNVTFADFADNIPLDPSNWKFYSEGWKNIATRNEAYKNMIRHNAISTEYFSDDIKVYAQYSGDIEKKGVLNWLLQSGSQISQKSKNIYSLEDQIYKAAAYAKYTSEGMTPAKACAEINKWFPNYRLLSPASKYWAKSPFGAPFIAFTDQAVKIAGRAAYEHPVKLMKWVLLPKALTEFSTWYNGMSPAEREVVDVGRNYFQPIIPARDKDGRALTWDLQWTIILANDLIPHSNRYGIDIPFALKGPMMDTIIRTTSGIDPFTGNPITKEDASFGRKIVDHAIAGAKGISPLPTLITYGPKRLYKSLGDDAQETLSRALMGTLLGLNLRAPYIEREKLMVKLRDDMISGDPDRIINAVEAIIEFNETYRSDTQPRITVQGLWSSIIYHTNKELFKELGLEEEMKKKY